MHHLHRLRPLVPALIVPLILWATVIESDEALYAKAPLRAITETSMLHPLSFSPILSWEKNVNATHYEIEFFREQPAICYPDTASSEAVWRSDDVYASSYNPPLFLFAADLLGRAPLYWRVRALDFDGTPVSLLGARSVRLNADEMLVVGGFNHEIYNWAVSNLSTLQGEEKYAEPRRRVVPLTEHLS